MYEELGLIGSVESAGRDRAYIEILAGRLEDAERHLRESCEASIRRNESSFVSSQAAELADVLYRLGRHDEAQSWALTARDRAGEGDLHAQVFWRAIEARLAARRGELELGVSLAKAAVEMMEQTDAISQHAKVLLDLAEVHRLGGNEGAAHAAVSQAEELYRAKGNIAALETVRDLLTTDAVV
jgi:tetratricopeptide (TPR) repeat protein